MSKPIDPWQRKGGKPLYGPDGRKLPKPLPPGVAYTWRRDKNRDWLTDADGDRVPGPGYRVKADAKTTPPGKARHTLTATQPTLAAAKQWLADVKAGVIDWTPPPPPAPKVETVAARLDLWLRSKGRKVRPVTLRGYSDASNHWRRAFGDCPTPDLTRAMVEQAVDGLTGQGLSGRTVRLAMIVLRGAMREAVAEGVISRDPTALVELPAHTPADKAAWTPEQTALFLAAVAGHRLAGCFWLSLAGLRRSELLGLKWSDIDLHAGTVTVARGRVAVDGSRVAVGEPKSRRSRRTLPVAGWPDLLDALRRLHTTRAAEHLALGAPFDGDAYLAVDEGLEPLRPERYSDLWREAVASVEGLPVLTLHEARHTAATLLLAAGVPVEVAADWLGHDPAVLMRTYNHTAEDRLAAAGAALGGMYANRKGTAGL